MQSWRFVNPAAWQMQNVFLITIPATIVFAWVFFWFCERPFMSKRMEARRDVEIAASLIITESPEHLTA